MTPNPIRGQRWLVPTLIGLVVFSICAPMAGSAWRRAEVLEAISAGPKAVSEFSPKEAAVAAALTPAQTAEAERAKAVLLGMIAAMALLPFLPFLRTWFAARNNRGSPTG
jgi:Na+-translocating ferredoxin:NAD+ oxidoreductase RnfD subunit